MPPFFQQTDFANVVLQAGQLILQGQRLLQQRQASQAQLEQREKEFEASAKSRELNLKLQAEKLQLEQELGPLRVAAAASGAESAESKAIVDVATEGARIQSANVGAQRAQGSFEFEQQIRPFKLQIEQSKAQMAVLEAEQAKVTGGGDLKGRIDLLNKQTTLVSNIMSAGQEAAKLHVKQPFIRDQILQAAGQGLSQKYGTREYGWFYNTRTQLDRASTERPGDRRRLLSGMGFANDAQAQQARTEIESVIGGFEGEISRFMQEKGIDVGQLGSTIGSVAENMGRSLGTGTQTLQAPGVPATSAIPSSTAELQLGRIADGDIGPAVDELINMAGDLSQKNGIDPGAALTQIMNSIPDPNRRAAIFQELTRRQNAGR